MLPRSLQRAPVLTVALALLALVLVAPSRAAAAPAPAPVTLDTGWEVVRDPGDTGTAGGRPLGLGDGWGPAVVPAVLDPLPTPETYPGSVAWYRVTFQAPPAADDLRWELRFGQVRRTAAVWLNGTPLGTHADPYTPFTLPATSLAPGAANTLVVRVDNRRGTPAPRDGWWNWGGITRPVALVPRRGIVLRDPAVLPSMDCDSRGRCRNPRVIVDAIVENHRTLPVAPAIALRLTAPDGAIAARARIPVGQIAPGAVERVRTTVPVTGRLWPWRPGRPDLYDARLETFLGDDLQQVDQQAVGMRDVAVRKGMLVLNGRQVNLRGASIHEDVPGHGSALTEADMDDVVARLKALHATITRAHYLLDPRLLDRFDRAGILVWEQAPIYHQDVALRMPAGRTDAITTLWRTAIASRTHPSVVTVSVANELSADADHLQGTRRYLDRARRLVQDLDPTRPQSVDILGWPTYPRQAVFGRFPLIGINAYFGWYPGKPGRFSTAHLADLAPFLRRTRKKYRDNALVLTEFGAEATKAGPSNRKGTLAFQARYAARVLDVVDRLPFLSGAIYWTLREFAIRPQWDGGAHRPISERDVLHHKGLLRYDGTPKPAFDVVRRRYAATPLFRPPPRR